MIRQVAANHVQDTDHHNVYTVNVLKFIEIIQMLSSYYLLTVVILQLLVVVYYYC